MSVRLLSLAASVAALVALVACSQNGSGPTCNAEIVYPFVELLSPQPGATGVSSGTQTLVLESIANGSSGTGPVPITLSTGSAAPIQTTPTGVPSPLPSGAASPAPGLNPSPSPVTFAVRVPSLNAGTTYNVFAQENIGGCVTGKTNANIGSFTTQ
jgi:hypothetical protein